MRILIHDYSGHPFQLQLSRALAERGDQVRHVYCPSYQSGKGAVTRREGDPATFSVVPVPLDSVFAKYSYARRIGQELQYARRWVRAAAEFSPDVIVSGNTPLFAQQCILSWARRQGIPFVFWQQDVYSVAMAHEARRLLRRPGAAVGWGFRRLEASMLRHSDAVVCISADFRDVLGEFGVAPDRVHVIENWAPIDELPVLGRDNSWATGQGLTSRPRLIYSGTLGLKHDPNLLLQSAIRQPGTDVVVISEGSGADWLRERSAGLGVANLILLGFQPYGRVAEVSAAADVLLVLLEPEAGVFSVPSKILTYLCAARPLLAAMPGENLGAAIIRRSGAGVVTTPGDVDAFSAAARALLDDPAGRVQMGQRARAYAETTFDIGRVADAFDTVIASALAWAGRAAVR